MSGDSEPESPEAPAAQAPSREELSRRERLLAAGVRADSQPRLVALAGWLRRRLSGDERYGEPLSTAGEKPVHQIARRVSALQPERPSALHEVGLGALQLWQSASEKSGRGRGERDVAMLDHETFSAGRSKSLRAAGAPKGFRVRSVNRA